MDRNVKATIDKINEALKDQKVDKKIGQKLKYAKNKLEPGSALKFDSLL